MFSITFLYPCTLYEFYDQYVTQNPTGLLLPDTFLLLQSASHNLLLQPAAGLVYPPWVRSPWSIHRGKYRIISQPEPLI